LYRETPTNEANGEGPLRRGHPPDHGPDRAGIFFHTRDAATVGTTTTVGYAGHAESLSSPRRSRPRKPMLPWARDTIPFRGGASKMQRIQQLSVPQKVLALAVALALVLAAAAVVGAAAAFVSGADGGPSGGKDQQRAAGEAPSERGSGQGSGQGSAAEEKAAEERAAEERAAEERAAEEKAAEENWAAEERAAKEYLAKVADIQNESVEAALESNDMLLRYDRLTAGDIEDMRANQAVLKASSDRAEGLDPPKKHGAQYDVFVLSIDELRDANELAYRLAADPASATQADTEAYDRHVERATAYLRRSNEMLNQEYKTTETAQGIGFR